MVSATLAMAPENPSKMPNLSDFHTRARPGMAASVYFWAEKFILVIIYQFLPRKAKIYKYIHCIFCRFNFRLLDFEATQLISIAQDFLWTDFQSSKSIFSSTLTMSKDFSCSSAGLTAV
jgi:hypothetical protein